jgi:hypothetical protein
MCGACTIGNMTDFEIAIPFSGMKNLINESRDVRILRASFLIEGAQRRFLESVVAKSWIGFRLLLADIPFPVENRSGITRVFQVVTIRAYILSTCGILSDIRCANARLP